MHSFEYGTIRFALAETTFLDKFSSNRSPLYPFSLSRLKQSAMYLAVMSWGIHICLLPLDLWLQNNSNIPLSEQQPPLFPDIQSSFLIECRFKFVLLGSACLIIDTPKNEQFNHRNINGCCFIMNFPITCKLERFISIY